MSTGNILSRQIAKHLRDLYLGGNWTTVNMKDTVAGIDWQQATAKYSDLNTIAALVFHTNYYVEAALKVLQGGPLDAHDKFAFDVPAISSEEDWQNMLQHTFSNVDLLALRIEDLDEDKFFTDFADPKYGNVFRNIFGIIEHTHYHLGQIVVLKKLLTGPGR